MTVTFTLHYPCNAHAHSLALPGKHSVTTILFATDTLAKPEPSYHQHARRDEYII